MEEKKLRFDDAPGGSIHGQQWHDGENHTESVSS